jgi:hypothetical protein
MRFYVEIDDSMLNRLDRIAWETCHYNLTGDQVADLREYVEASGYDWHEIAFVYEQRKAA